MLFTPEQFIVLAAVLLGGWLLGYVSAPNPKKWKRRVLEQSESFTAHYEHVQDQLRAAHSRAANLTADLEALRADHVEAERTIVALRGAAAAVPAAAVSAVPSPVAPAEPEPGAAIAQPETPTPATITDAASPSQPPKPEAHFGETHHASLPATEGPKLDAPEAEPTPAIAPAPRDVLTRIRGIDEALQARLSDLGIVRFEDVEKLSAQDEMALEQRLALPAGYVAREQWRPQAALLRAGQSSDHAAHLAATEPAPL